MKNQKIFDYLKLKGWLAYWVISIPVQSVVTIRSIPKRHRLQRIVNTVSVFENNYLPDPNLHWETVHTKEIGIEFNMLDNRLHGDINYYNKRPKIHWPC